MGSFSGVTVVLQIVSYKSLLLLLVVVLRILLVRLHEIRLRKVGEESRKMQAVVVVVPDQQPRTIAFNLSLARICVATICCFSTRHFIGDTSCVINYRLKIEGSVGV